MQSECGLTVRGAGSNAAMTAPFLRSGDRILFEGDSLTQGLGNNYGRLMAWDQTWAHAVDEWLFLHRADLRLSMRNQAVGGSDARHLIERLPSAEAWKPDVVLVTIGTNDAIQNLPLDGFRQQLSAWRDRLHANGCRLVVHVSGFLAYPHADDFTRGLAAKAPAYWAVAREVFAAPGCAAIDVHPYLSVRTEALSSQWADHTIYSHGVHFNRVGNQLIAGAVLRGLGMMELPGSPH
jgi:lysophospholipase L1-like esterase